MWCDKCESETAGRVDSESKQLLCGRCDTPLTTRNSRANSVQHAREIVSKWSSNNLFDQIASFPSMASLPASGFGSRRSESANLQDGEKAENTESNETRGASAGRDETHERQTTDGDLRLKVAADFGERPGEESSVDTQESAEPHIHSLADHASRAGTNAVSDAEESVIQPALRATGTDGNIVAYGSTVNGPNASGQPKNPQGPRGRSNLPRRPLSRNVRLAATTQSASSDEGTATVSKKYRVDHPGQLNTGDEPISMPSGDEAYDARAQDAPVTRRYRIDTSQSVQDVAGSQGRVRTHGRTQRRYIDEGHAETGLRGPHFAVSAPKRSGLTSLTGQFLAYIGVLGLTIGTAVVIYGHFGGHSEYTPTGWLVTTVAQMLLFLGVINLVSGGIEQNNEDVSRRINVLGEQLLRIEQVAEDALRGPKISVGRYAGSEEYEDSEQETVMIEERR